VKSSTKEILCGLAIFARVGDGALEAVARRTVIRTVASDTILFRRGEPCKGLYVVLSGTVRVYRASPDGREQVLHVQGAGQPLAEVPLMDGGPYPASARTTTETRILFLPRNDFEWLYQNHPEIADSVIRELVRRLRRMVRLVEKISLKDVPARVAATLLEYAEVDGVVTRGTEFRLPRTQEELAAELATTRESVARALSRLRREGIIDTRGARVRVVDPVALEAIAFGGGGSG
jgi:CRP-like cAMP-binding protein